MKKYKIGVIGIGDISHAYLDNLLEFPEIVELWGCASRHIEKAKAKAEAYNMPKYYASGEDLIADPEIDIVLNLTTPKAHYLYNKKALEAGKHVYSEKPLASTFQEGKELLAIAKEKGLMIGCAPDTFMGGRLQTYKKLLEDGSMGQIFGATATSVGRGNEWFHPNPDFFYQEGAGPLHDIGPYYVTALLALLGPVKRVCAMGTTAEQDRVIESEPLKGQTIHVDPQIRTHITGTLEFASGVIGTLIMSFDVWDSELPRMEIYGTRGTLCMLEPDPCDGPNLFGGEVLFRNRENYRWKELPRNPKDVKKPWQSIPVTHQYNSTTHAKNSRGIGLVDMAFAIRDNRKARADASMALHALEVMESVVRSAKENRYIEMTTSFTVPEILPEQGLN